MILRYFQCLHLLYSEVAWVLVSSGTQVQLQAILEPDYLPGYLSVSYDYVVTYTTVISIKPFIKQKSK